LSLLKINVFRPFKQFSPAYSKKKIPSFGTYRNPIISISPRLL